MAEQKAAAFMSYVHLDDEAGHVTNFHKHLKLEVSMAVGFDFPIFLDTEDIGTGQNWMRRIEDALDESLFFIPILTPSFFNSEYCRAELRGFLERERKLKRDDLILPVYFRDTLLLNEEELRAKDELAVIIAARQRFDWRNLRHELFTTPLVGQRLEYLATQIRDALPRVTQTRQKPMAIPVLVPSETQQSSAPADEESGVKPAPTKVEPPTRVVDPMHRGDFTTISEAILKSAPGTRILVRPGQYDEALVIDKPLEIIGEGETASEVVVQASGNNVILFQTTMGRVTNLTLRQTGGGNWYAIDISQGRLELEDCDITSQSLACVAIHNGADPRLRRNRIHNGDDSGVYVYANGLGTLEDNDISSNVRGVQIISGANPTLRRNRIHDSKFTGVLIFMNGLGTLEENDIFGNAYSGVQIASKSTPTLRRNRIHDGKQGGVLFFGNGLGMVEDNEIYANANVGVEVREGSNPTLRNNRINKNGYQAVWVHKGGSGTFEDNDLRDNKRGAWLIAADSEANVKRSNNQE